MLVYCVYHLNMLCIYGMCMWSMHVVYMYRMYTVCVRISSLSAFRASSSSVKRLIIHTVVGGDTGDGVHVIFDGTDRLAAFMDSLPLKIKRVRGLW